MRIQEAGCIYRAGQSVSWRRFFGFNPAATGGSLVTVGSESHTRCVVLPSSIIGVLPGMECFPLWQVVHRLNLVPAGATSQYINSQISTGWRGNPVLISTTPTLHTFISSSPTSLIHRCHYFPTTPAGSFLPPSSLTTEGGSARGPSPAAAGAQGEQRPSPAAVGVWVAWRLRHRRPPPVCGRRGARRPPRERAAGVRGPSLAPRE